MLAPGIDQVLGPDSINNFSLPLPGLVGAALSGSGPTVIAFATDNFERIGQEIAGRFEAQGVKATAHTLAVEQQGRMVY
jgi:homoserine kinase